jgi:hypothetical protein
MRAELFNWRVQFTNLNSHMSKHQESREWYRLYTQVTGAARQNFISEDLANLVKFSISSNSPIAMLKNPFLRRLIAPSIDIPGIYSFRYKILPDIFEKMKHSIQEKCHKAASITLYLMVGQIVKTLNI